MDVIDVYYLRMFCKTLNPLFLTNLTEKTHNKCKKTVTDYYINSYKKIENKNALEIMNNFYNYKKPDINPVYPNLWHTSKGFIAIPLDLPNSEKFQVKLLKCTNKWFHSQIDEKEYPKLATYDLTNINTLINIFDSKWKKKNLNGTEIEMIRKALDGGANAQFQPWKGWRKSGFGLWTHLRGIRYIYKEVLPQTLKIYKKLYNGNIKSRSIPHIIFKPPMNDVDSSLKPHNDSGSWNDMYTRCLQCESVEKWVENYGIQILAHMNGARKKDGGQTTLLGPMDTDTYLIILQMLHPKTIHTDLPIKDKNKSWESLWYTAKGPNFYGWYETEVLEVINRVVKLLKEGKVNDIINKSDKKWIEELKNNDFYDLISTRAKKSNYTIIKKIKMLPEEVFDSSYVVACPNGFIHGSYITGLTPRLTLTIPYSPEGDKERSKRGLKRLENLAKRNIDKVLKDTEPYEDGKVHQSTKTEIELLEFFENIYITEDDIPSIKKLFDT